MLMQRLTFFLVIVDLVLAVISLALGYIFRFDHGLDPVAFVGPAGVRLMTFVVATVFSAYFCEMYRWELQLAKLDLAARTAVSILLAFFTLSALYYIVPEALIDRSYLSLALLIFGGFQLLSHLMFLKILEFPGLASRILIIGTGPLAKTIEKTLGQRKSRYVFAGFVQPTADIISVPQAQVVGHIDDIKNLVRQEKVSRLIVAITERRGVLPVRELLRCKLEGVDIVEVLSFYEEISGKLLIENIQPSWFLYSDGFKITPFLRFYKRFFDILFSSIGIILALPLVPIIALLVRIDSSGPLFFWQTRVGEREEPFTVYKVRTMRQDAEQATGAVWASENDPRVTTVGKFLRKTRIDELPQLYNVLKGDMSFIGPRPERPEFVARLNEKIPYYSKRHFMKPGITGWAQVCYPYGASDEDALEKLRYDLYYIKNYSLLLDFLIVLETIKVVLLGRGGR